MEKINVNRRGKIKIDGLINNMPAEMHKAFGFLELIPFNIRYDDYIRNVTIMGFSPKFEVTISLYPSLFASSIKILQGVVLVASVI